MSLLFRRNGVLSLVLTLSFSTFVWAQDQIEQPSIIRKSVITSFEAMAGGANRLSGLGLTSFQDTSPFFYYYSAFPSIDMNFRGARSAFSAAYAFGFNQTQASTSFRSTTHSVSVNFAASLNPKWRVDLSEAFRVSNDILGFNLLRGVPTQSELISFVFTPVTLHESIYTNTARVSLGYTVNEKSSFSFAGSTDIRRQARVTSIPGSLYDQQHAAGSVAYSLKTRRTESWSFTYGASYYDFQGAQNALSHSGEVAYSNQISSSLTYRIATGASRVKTQNSPVSYIGYNTSASLTKVAGIHSFSLFFSQTSGTASGLGTLSDTRQAGLSFGRTTRNMSLTGDFFAFDSRGKLGNTYDVRGFGGALSLGIPVTKTISVRTGAQFQRDDQSIFAFTQRRAFVSLRYSDCHGQCDTGPGARRAARPD